MTRLLWLLVFLLISLTYTSCQDSSTEERASGSAVVLLAVAKIQQSGAFGSDNDILRRIAYVETRDGTLSDTFREGYNGGLWAVDEDEFLRTQSITLNNRLPAKMQQIQQLLGIDWQTAQWRDLRKPLYSALAARLILFIANTAIPSAGDLEAQARFWRLNYNQIGDTAEFVSSSSGLEGSILESSANEFFVGFARNYALEQLSVFVTTSEPEPVNFAITATGFSFSGVATSNTSTQIVLPNSLEVQTTNDSDKGIFIKAEGSKKIVVYGLSYQQHTSDAFLALPCNNLAVDQYEYYAISYDVNVEAPSYLLIVACEDNTLISTASTSFTLNRQQTYQFESLSDLTGTRITTSKPVSVFSAHQCTNIPTGVGACDHLTEQVPPTSTWGTRFLVASLLGRSSGERLRILSAQASIVNVNCTTFSEPNIYTLNNGGDWTEIEILPNSYCSIEASSPIFVSQYGSGNGLDGVGDPFMMMIPPIEQYSNNYVLDVLPEFSTNYITIYVAPEYYHPQNIFVDNSPISEWFVVHCAEDNMICGYISRVSVSSGEHRLYHQDASARVGVSAYGFNEFNSYGYPGGLKLIPVQLATVSLSSATYTVSEDDGAVHVNITRSGATDTSAIVLIATDNFKGTASADKDYAIVTQIVEFQVGETETTVFVEIKNDERIEVNETFEVYLTGGGGVHLSPISRAVITIEDNDGTISIEPSYGTMLGGTGVTVTLQSDKGSEKTKDDDEIYCMFDGVEVRGVFLSSEKSLCVSPLFTRTGRLAFQLRIPRSDFFAESVFTSLSFRDAFEVYIANDDLLFSPGTMVNVRWSPQSIFPMENADTYSVDIDLLELNKTSKTWYRLLTLDSDIPNNGSAKVRIPVIEDGRTLDDSLSPVIVRVGLSSASTDGSRLKKRGINSKLLQDLGRFGLQTSKSAPVRYLLAYLAVSGIQRWSCEAWGLRQPSNIGEQIMERLPPCPRSVAEIEAPNSGFRKERVSSIIDVIGEIQDYFGTTVIDDAFRTFFHPGSESCYRQRVTDSFQTGGSGQQCCYGNDGLLNVGPTGGGTVDLVSPDVDFLGHFLDDVVPFLLCCKAGIFSDCDEYYENRPSDRGPQPNYSPPPPPACVYGDPHIITLDGYKYTFNGKGEFVLIETNDESFSLQARMVPINSATGDNAVATVFNAIVAKQANSDTVQFEITKNGTIVVINGDEIDFSAISEQEFGNLTVTDLGNSSFSATFSSGAYIEVTEENGIFSVLIVSLPETYKSSGSRGLMGSFNGYIADDLLPKLSLEPLPLDSNIQELHKNFGLTWIIDIPSDSLFTYQPGESWDTYYDPFFTPAYQPVFTDSELESLALSICGDDVFCLFDIAATGRTDIGLSTLIGNQNYEEILGLQIPVVCSTPCVNGVCVANDTCKCADGYSGNYCNISMVTACEESPCQNGGTCTKRVLTYMCECPADYGGDFCEIALNIRVNDTVISDPLMTVPLYVQDMTAIMPLRDDDFINLCFEVHGRADAYFNLVSDDCTNVNAHYAQILPNENINIIDEIAVRAVDSDGVCQNINIELEQCTASVGGVVINNTYSRANISVRKYQRRARISVPNCRSAGGLVMWVFCQRQEFLSTSRTTPDGSPVSFEGDAIRFVITRGLNLQESSHGILGQFWNVPIDVEPYRGPFTVEPAEEESAFVVTVNYPGKDPRQFIAWLDFPSWETERNMHCLFAGNAQAGHIFEVPSGPVNSRVIEGKYKDYIMPGQFETGYTFSHFNSSHCL